jgi:hypothetical protein
MTSINAIHTFPWDGESAQIKPQLINDVPNKEKNTLNRPTISLPITERAIKTLGVTNCMDFFEEICLKCRINGRMYSFIAGGQRAN